MGKQAQSMTHQTVPLNKKTPATPFSALPPRWSYFTPGLLGPPCPGMMPASNTGGLPMISVGPAPRMRPPIEGRPHANEARAANHKTAYPYHDGTPLFRNDQSRQLGTEGRPPHSSSISAVLLHQQIKVLWRWVFSHSVIGKTCPLVLLKTESLWREEMEFWKI